MRHISFRSVPSTTLILALACGSIATTAIAHDDDYRKLLDKQSPIYGPIWTQNQTIQNQTTQNQATQNAGTYATSNMTLLAQLPLNNFTGLPSTASGNDCWGYVAPSGREYIIMGLEGGYGFVEVTNPTNPIIIDTIPGPVSAWHDVKVVGQYAYGVSEGGSGIQIIDLSNIDNGSVTLVQNWTSGGYSTSHNIVTNEDTNSLWVVGTNIGNGGLIHIDISNPTAPQIDGGWTEMYVHDAQVVTWQGGAYDGRELAFLASGFSSGWSETGLRIADVTDPNNPVTLATLFYPNSGYSHQCWLSTDRKILYLNDELDEGNSVSVTTTRMINVEDPANPYFLGTFTTGLPAIDHNLYTRDHILYQSNYRSGLRVFDALDSSNPVEIASIDTYPNDDSPNFNGSWSNYPFLPSGTIAISDIERGLFLVRLDATLDGFALQQRDDQPQSVSPDGGDTISVNTVLRSGISLTNVSLYADTGSGFNPIPMTDNGDGSYSTTSPQIDCNQPLTYYYQGTDNTGLTKTLPANAPTTTYSANVVSSVTPVFDDNFETNTGWSVSGSVTDGAWERAIPAGGGGRGDPATDFDGSGRCYLTDNVAGNSDVDGGTTTLTSPPMDASGSGTPTLTYALWYSNNIGETDDTMFIDISNNNGNSWQALDTIGPGDPNAGGGWNTYAFDLTQIYANPSSQVRVRFRAGDLGAGSVVEAGVDAVKIELSSCQNPTTPCPADMNGDGSVGFPDVSAFIAAFQSGDPAADFNNDGSIGFPDVSAFVAAFQAGCP